MEAIRDDDHTRSSAIVLAIAASVLEDGSKLGGGKGG